MKPAVKEQTEKGFGSELALANRGNEMQPYHEALRDRLVSYFEIREMTHKPKMIAVTSCGQGSGVSSLATGLAASLSETGDGNVLLVDMRGERGTAHAFYHGQATCGLAEALESATRTNALVNGHLYVVSADSADSDLQRILPRQFSNMVPRLKASDYDYIIFDMPPVGQTSITAKVARFMDMVLMVLESEKTDRDVAIRARDVLAESNATVAAILNKRRRYVPFWLQQELL
jgi:Mrp family chromosome partitioning ATPase